MSSQLRLLTTALLPFAAVAAFAQPATSRQPADDLASRAWVQQMFALYEAGSAAAPVNAPSPIAQSLATWDWLRRVPRVGAEPPLNQQSWFITNHPDWPGVTAIRRRAEAQAALPRTPDYEARAFLTAVAPQTAMGQARLALLSTGREAEDLARAAWTRTGLTPDMEDAVLARFGAVLNRRDHERRADALIWAGQTSAAGRLLPRLGDDVRALVMARIALRSGAADAEARVASVPASLRREAGLVHDRVLWLERKGRVSEAEALLASGDVERGNNGGPETWLEKRLQMGRAAMRRGNHQLAYRILANHRTYREDEKVAELPLSQRVDLSDAEWLAGWIALRRLNKPDDAATHFRNFLDAVNTPISQSRGEYWLGRAEKARGRTAEAQAAFEKAAEKFDYFYGQLAAEELGRLPQLPQATPAQVTAADRTAFDKSMLRQAVQLLHSVNSRERESLFIRALGSSVQTPAMARLVADFGHGIGRADLGVWTWKTARPQGDLNAFDRAYPMLPANALPQGRDSILSQAIARQESSFDRTAISSAGARGLMQLMPATAQDVARKLQLPYDRERLLSDPAYNIRLGSYYIGLRRDNFRNAAMAIAAYNAGAGNVSKWVGMNGDPRAGTDPIDWVEMIPFQETRNYVQRVTENAVVYSLLDPKQPGAKVRASDWLRGS